MNNSFENTNKNVNENKSTKLFEYKEIVNTIIEKVSSLESDWNKIEEVEDSFPSLKKGIEVIEFLTSDEIADGPFIRNFYYDLENFVEEKNSEGNYSIVRKFVRFNYCMKTSQEIIWKLRDEKDKLIESMTNIKDFEVDPVVDEREILYISNFYLLMKSLDSFLREMINIFNSEIKK